MTTGAKNFGQIKNASIGETRKLFFLNGRSSKQVAKTLTVHDLQLLKQSIMKQESDIIVQAQENMGLRQAIEHAHKYFGYTWKTEEDCQERMEIITSGLTALGLEKLSDPGAFASNKTRTIGEKNLLQERKLIGNKERLEKLEKNYRGNIESLEWNKDVLRSGIDYLSRKNPGNEELQAQLNTVRLDTPAVAENEAGLAESQFSNF